MRLEDIFNFIVITITIIYATLYIYQYQKDKREKIHPHIGIRESKEAYFKHIKDYHPDIYKEYLEEDEQK